MFILIANLIRSPAIGSSGFTVLAQTLSLINEDAAVLLCFHLPELVGQK